MDGSVECNVTIEPKAEWVKPEQPIPSKPHKPHVKTGDDTGIRFFLILEEVALLAGILVLRKGGRKN